MLTRAGAIFLMAITFAGTAMSGTYPNPYITGFSPASGPAGTVITVNGSGFTGLNSAWIGSGHDAQVHVVSDSVVQVTVPADGTTAHVAVLNPEYSHFSATNFTVTKATGAPVTTPAPVAGATGYAIAGTVTGFANSSIKLNGNTTQYATTDSSGSYTFSGLANGSYTVEPNASGHVFSPASQAKTLSGASLSGVNFSSSATSAATYSISGTVTGAVGSGVLITLNGANVGSAVTDLGGNYSFTGLVSGTYTVNASLSGHSFTQAKVVTLSNVDASSDNFTSTVSPSGSKVAFTAVNSLPQATVGTAYSSSVVKSISGNTAPYNYQTGPTTAGTPPVGMILNPNGTLTGTAKIAGTYDFSVCAHDAVGNASACSTTSIVVVAAKSITATTTSGGGTTTTAPAAGTSWVYYDGIFDWPGDFSFVATPDYTDTSGGPLSGPYDIKVTLTSAWGGWQPYALNFNFNAAPYSYLVFSLKPTVANQKWNVYFMNVGDTLVTNASGQAIYIDPTDYGPAPVVGQWNSYSIPLSALGVAGKSVYKFCIHDETGLSSNVWYVDNVGFAP